MSTFGSVAQLSLPSKNDFGFEISSAPSGNFDWTCLYLVFAIEYGLMKLHEHLELYLLHCPHLTLLLEITNAHIHGVLMYTVRLISKCPKGMLHILYLRPLLLVGIFIKAIKSCEVPWFICTLRRSWVIVLIKWWAKKTDSPYRKLRSVK